jgi:hypothetical protein
LWFFEASAAGMPYLPDAELAKLLKDLAERFGVTPNGR